MFGAQSLLRSRDTSAETAAPLADISIHDHWSKRVQSSIGRISRTLTLAILGGKLSPAWYSRCYSRLGSDPVNSTATVLEEWSRAPITPGKRRWLVLDAPVHRPVERQNPTLGYPEYI